MITLFPRIRTVSIALLVFGISLFLGGCSAQSDIPKFDSDRAFSILKKQCDFGPRPPGTKAHDLVRDYLAGEMKQFSGNVKIDSFNYSRSGSTYHFSNIIAKFGKANTHGILLCAHWDTRPTADEELDVANQKKPILGANDGASGVAVLLELARMFHEKPPSVPVTVVLFDGEDFGPSTDDMFLGSRHFAKVKYIPGFKYGILLDMIGDKDLQIYREGNSQDKAKFVNNKIWKAASDLGYAKYFKDEVKYTISDDHIPLIQSGIPCADVIDFDYGYWHTLDDTVDKCSAQSLKIVGETIAKVVYSEHL